MILIKFVKLFLYTRNFIRLVLIIFLLYILLTIFIFIFYPTVVFALGPDEIIDYYGNTEYIGKDPYGHFHNSTFNKDESTIPTTSSYMYQDNYIRYYESYSLIDKVRIRLHWYGWKKYTSDYKSFSQYKYIWNPNNSLRKEIMEFFKKG